MSRPKDPGAGKIRRFHLALPAASTTPWIREASHLGRRRSGRGPGRVGGVDAGVCAKVTMIQGRREVVHILPCPSSRLQKPTSPGDVGSTPSSCTVPISAAVAASALLAGGSWLSAFGRRGRKVQRLTRDQARRLRELGHENARLKKLIAAGSLHSSGSVRGGRLLSSKPVGIARREQLLELLRRHRLTE